MTQRISVTDLLPSTNYVLRVRAKNGASLSEWSVAVPFATITDAVPPNTPTGFSWTVVDDSFHAVWNAVTQNTNNDNITVSRYDVRLVVGGTTKIITVPQSTSDTVTFDLPFEQNRALFGTPAPAITCSVRAVDNKELVGAYAAGILATNPVPGNPTGFTGTGGTGTIDLVWVPPADTDLIGYNLYLGAVKIWSGDATRFTYQTVIYTSQSFTVKAVDKFGQESTTGASTTATASSPFSIDVTAPSVPTGLAATITANANGVGATAAVSWTAVTGATDLAGYVVRYRRNGTADNWVEVTVSDDTIATLVPLNSIYTSYDFQVRSFDFYSNFSAWATIVTASGGSNVAPANVSTPTSTAGRDSITYNWTAVADTDIKNYEVTFSTSSTFASGNTTYLTGTSTTLTVGGLSPSTTYYARVRAVDTGGLTSAAFSSTNTTATTAFPLTPLSDGQVPGTGNTPVVTPGIGNLNVTWAPVTLNVLGAAQTDLVTYQVHISTSTGFTPGPGTRAVDTAGTVASLELTAGGTALAYGTTYYVKIVPTDRDGTGAASAQASGSPAQVGSADSTLTAANVGADPTGTAAAVGATKNTTFVQGSAPTSLAIGDVWINTADNNKIYTANAIGATTIVTSGSGWYIRTDLTTKNAIFVQSGTPTATKAGDLWVDTGNGNVLKSWSGSAWVLSNDAAISTAQTTANGKNTIFVQSATPSATKIGDIWIDTGNGNLLKTANATGTGGWVSSQDAAIATAQTTANGKNKVIWSTSAASGTVGYVAGDVWFQTSGGNVIAQWNFTTSWQSTLLTDSVISSLTVGKLSTGTLGAININVGASGVIQSNDYSAGTAGWKLGTGGLEINNGTIRAAALSITPGGGNLFTNSSFTDAIASAAVSAGTTPPTIAQSTTQSRGIFGNKSLAVTFPASVSTFAAANVFIGQGIPIINNQSATFSMWVYNKPADIHLLLTGSMGVADLVLVEGTASTWARYALTFNNTSGSTQTLNPYIYSTGSGGAPPTFYVDDIQAEIGDVRTSYAPRTDEILSGTIIGTMLSAAIAFVSNLTINTGGSIQSALYTSSGGTSGFQLTDTGLTVKSGVVNANTLVSGTGILNALVINTGGAIQSGNWSTGTAGWKISAAGAEFNDTGTSIKVSTLTSGSLNGSINISGGGFVLNGGNLRSNTYNGAGNVFDATATAGFYLGNDGLMVAQGTIKANALVAGTFTGGAIVIGAGGSITSTGFSLSNTGLTLTTGSVAAAALNIQSEKNLLPPEYSDFEANSSFYTVSGVNFEYGGNLTLTTDNTIYKMGTQSLKAVTTGVTYLWFGRGSSSTVAQTMELEASTTYIISFYAYVSSGGTVNVQPTIRSLPGPVNTSGGSMALSGAAWTRYSTTITTPATAGQYGFYLNINSSGTTYFDGFMVEKKLGNLNTPSAFSMQGGTRIDGAFIRTGAILSTGIAQVWDVNANAGTGTSITITTNATTTVTSSTNAFAATDVGKVITNANIPAGATITAFASAGSVTISAAATGSATNTTGVVYRSPLGGYKNDPANTPAWSVDLAGNAQFGRAQVRGSLIIGDAYTTGNASMNATQQSFMASSTYSPGVSGWMMRADGVAEFRAVAIGSFPGNAVQDGTLRAESIVGGVIKATVSIGSTLETSQQQIPIKVNTTVSSTTITANPGAFYTDDIGVTITGPGIPAGATIATVPTNGGTGATISVNATATATAVDAFVYRGRRVRISGVDGVTLSNGQGIPVIQLPTDPSKDALFTGTIRTSDLFVKNNFRMLGTANSIEQGGALNLAASTYVPASAPAITFDWQFDHLHNIYGVDYSPNSDPYVNLPVSFVYDAANGKYLYASEFFGTQITQFSSSTYNVISTFQPAMLNYGGANEVLYGGLTLDTTNSNFYALGNQKGTSNWVVELVSKTNFYANNATPKTALTWNPNYDSLGIAGFPSIGARNGNLYIAKINNSGELKVQKYTNHAALSTGSAYVGTFAGFGTYASVVSVNAGTFDMGGSVYVVITAILGSGFTYNWVLLDNGSSLTMTTYYFPVPYNKPSIGLTWVGTSNDDSTGHFRVLTTDGTIYRHTALGAVLTTNNVSAFQKWRDGSVGLGSSGPTSAPVGYSRRARMTITSTATVPNLASPAPNAVTFYVIQDTGSAITYYDPANGTGQPVAGKNYITVTDFQVSNATSGIGGGALSTGTAATITSANGLYIQGDGHAHFPGTGWQVVGSGGSAAAWGTGWGNFNTASFGSARYRRVGTRVDVEGLITRTSGVVTVPFVLPTGYRPNNTNSGIKIFTTGHSGGQTRLDFYPETGTGAGQLDLPGFTAGTGNFTSVNASFYID